MKKFDPKAFEEATVNRRNRTRYGRGRDYPAKRKSMGSAEALQIRATSGLGKTFTGIKSIAIDPRLRNAEVNYFVANQDHAAEVARIAQSFGLRTVTIHGRTSDPDSPGYCARYHLTRKAVKVGLSVYQTCCQTERDGREHLCPHFEHCPYLSQWVDDKPALRIMNHIYAFLPRPNWDGAGLPDPQLAIVDESVLDK